MASLKHLDLVALFIYLSTISTISAQPILQWDARYNGPANNWDTALAITVDDSGNVYVTGASPGVGTDRDYATIKYTSDGDTLWVRRFNSPENGFDIARDIALDDSGNVYVTGGSVTLKYDANGIFQWFAQNNGECFRVLLDDSGYVYAAGAGFGNYVTNKFDANGNLIWRRTYNGPANDRDDGYDMAMDSQGNIIVTGRSWGTGTHWDYATIKYSSDGDTLWVRRYNGPAADVPTDMAYAVAVDDSANVYVTGLSRSSQNRFDCVTISYSPEGELRWLHRYPNSGSQGYGGDDILVDAEGYIYVAARAGNNDTLLKYGRGGNLIWARANPAELSLATSSPRLALDSFGNIYMSTGKDSVPTGTTFAAVKYDPMGNRLWLVAYLGLGGPINANEAYALHVDASGNVYLAGESLSSGQWFDYATVKYSQVTGIAPISNNIAEGFRLDQNYPNPFNATTTIPFSIPAAAQVMLKVYNILGQEVATLVNEKLAAGNYAMSWEATDFASGVYIYRIQAGDFVRSRKMLLLR